MARNTWGLLSTVATDALVLKRQAIIIHSGDYVLTLYWTSVIEK